MNDTVEKENRFLTDMENPVTKSINRMKMVKRFTKVEGLREMMDLNYFKGHSSFYSYYNSERRVFTNLGIPKEMFYMLDIDMLFVEQLSAMVGLAGKDENRQIISKSRSIVPSSTYCTFHQASLGAIEYGYFPLPQILVAPSFICEETPNLFAYLGEKYDIPVLYIDCPATTDDESVAYLAGQLKDVVYAMADHFRIDLDPDRVRDTIEYANQARKWWVDYQQLRTQIKGNATPITTQTLLLSTMLYSKFGMKETIDVTRKSYLDLKKQIERKEWDAADPDEVRILWLHLLPYQSSSSSKLTQLLKDLKINLVADIMSQITWDTMDPADPWKSLARKYMQSFGYGKISNSLHFIEKMIADFRVEGVVELCHPGCKPGSGKSHLVKAYLNDKGVPHLGVEIDLIDQENFSYGQLKLRLEAFTEMIRNSRSRTHE